MIIRIIDGITRIRLGDKIIRSFKETTKEKISRQEFLFQLVEELGTEYKTNPRNKKQKVRRVHQQTPL